MSRHPEWPGSWSPFRLIDIRYNSMDGSHLELATAEVAGIFGVYDIFEWSPAGSLERGFQLFLGTTNDTFGALP